MADKRGGKISETDTSESVYESDVEETVMEREETDVVAWIVYYVDMWKCYWKTKRFFRQVVRSGIVFVIGLKLLREIKGLDILPSTFSQVVDEHPC